MIQIKKTILTLVALLAVTTGAWATDVYLVGNGDGNWLNGVAWDPGAAGNKMTEQNGVYSITFTNVAANSALFFKFAINGTWDENYGCSSDDENELNKTLSNIELFGTNFKFGLTETADVTISFNPSEVTYMISTKGMKVGDDASSGTPVEGFAWDAKAKTGTFTMPGGNVTLEPEYYPQATVADGAVTAADADARATTDDPLVKVDATKLTGAKKLMYFVSNSGTTAPAYDAEGWTDQLPTAEGFTEAGIVYVWYYPVGTDEGQDGATATYSDGDICLESITARIADAPTYAVTFAEGTPESDKWTAEPNTGVTKGKTVTVTYTGSKKVIGVKAEKKAPAAGIVNPEVGQVIGSDGKNYAYGSLPTGVTAVAKICYVSGSNGLALALTDEEESYMNWSTAQTTCAAHTPAITGGTWKLATKDEWNSMFNAAGSYDDLREGFGFVGGTNMKEDYPYWSSTEDGSDKAWIYSFSYGLWTKNNKDSVGYVRACLAF